jgi:antitoxin component of MazEF toxin-antitoxin module
MVSLRKLRRHGNSSVVTVSRDEKVALGVSEGDTVATAVQDGELRVIPIPADRDVEEFLEDEL